MQNMLNICMSATLTHCRNHINYRKHIDYRKHLDYRNHLDYRDHIDYRKHLHYREDGRFCTRPVVMVCGASG